MLLGCKLCYVSHDGKKPLHVRGKAWPRTGRERSSGMQIDRRIIYIKILIFRTTKGNDNWLEIPGAKL